MIELQDEMLLYRGSYIGIPKIDLSRCFANRKKDLFPQLLKKYGTIDIIGGKIADDQTARTLQRYIGGTDFGIPGTPEADKTTIEKLLPNRLKDQFCFRTQDAIDHLEFIRSDRYGDIKL